MIYQPRKDALYRLAIEHGIGTPDEIGAFLPLGSSVPKPRLQGWLHQLFRTPKTFASTRRYVNRFKLGADPEFVFASNAYDTHGRVVASSRADASSLGLAQGPAFGADNNGRLAEIRPYPSRSAVEVLASILCTLRWMALQVPVTVKYEWLSGAYLMDDGIGGHVHFGRKRPSRKTEVAALDQIEEGLLNLGVYPKEQVLRRRQGDARRQIYGALGDFRLQTHGYEYRTFPSWLDSPELAYLTLVVSKLAVQMPDLYKFKGGSPSTEYNRLKNFIAYFKGVDDDARLALVLLDRGMPQHRGGNFAPRWGIVPENVAKLKKNQQLAIIPPNIKPDSASVQEVFEYLQSGKPLSFRIPEVTWKPTSVPPNYIPCLQLANTIQAKGLGEMIWDLCCHSAQPITFCTGHRGTEPLLFSKDLIKQFPFDWKKQFRGLARQGEMKYGHVMTAPESREGWRGVLLRRLLLNGLLPVWRVQDCKEDSYKLWQEQAKHRAPVSRKLAGSVLFESQPFKDVLGT